MSESVDRLMLDMAVRWAVMHGNRVIVCKHQLREITDWRDTSTLLVDRSDCKVYRRERVSWPNHVVYDPRDDIAERQP